MIWPFKKKKDEWGKKEMIRLLYNWYLDGWFKDNPDILEHMKNKIPGFDPYNFHHNLCAIIMMLSDQIHAIKCKTLLLEKILSDKGIYK